MTQRHGRLSLLLLAAFAAIATRSSVVVAQTDVIRGRVTTIEGLPLSSVRVSATSIPGNVTRTARTDNRGSFQIVFPGGPGDYMMGYALIGYVYRQFQIKRVADEDVLIANATLAVVQLDTIAVVAPVQQRVGRNSPTPDVSGTERPVAPGNLPPELQGDIAAMAASLPGVLLVSGLDGGADGFSVLGLGADQNSVTLNGMQFGANGLRPIPAKPTPGGPVYDVVSRSGEMIDRLQLPPGYTIVGCGKGRVVYLSMRDATGLHLARVRLK